MRYFLSYLAIGTLTMGYYAHNMDCRNLDRSTCVSFAMGEGYFAGVLWPLYWSAELLVPDTKQQHEQDLT